jgi:hypothetical protein
MSYHSRSCHSSSERQLSMQKGGRNVRQSCITSAQRSCSAYAAQAVMLKTVETSYLFFKVLVDVLSTGIICPCVAFSCFQGVLFGPAASHGLAGLPRSKARSPSYASDPWIDDMFRYRVTHPVGYWRESSKYPPHCGTIVFPSTKVTRQPAFTYLHPSTSVNEHVCRVDFSLISSTHLHRRFSGRPSYTKTKNTCRKSTVS